MGDCTHGIPTTLQKPPGLYRFLQPVTMKTPAASAIVTIFNRIKSGSNAQGWAALGPPVIQSARHHVLEQARDVIGWPRRALVARSSTYPRGRTCAHLARMRASSSLLERATIGKVSRRDHGLQASMTTRALRGSSLP